MSRIRLIPALVFFAVTMLLLFGGWFLYRDYGLIRPLQKELIETKQVSMVDIKLNGPQKIIEVSFNQIPDLQQAYRTVRTKIGETIDPNVNIKVIDKRDHELESIFQAYQPMIYEGITKGSFTEMIGKVQDRGGKDGLSKVVISMDRENLYVQLEKGDKYLYEVIPYSYSKSSVSQQGVKSL